MKQPLVSVIVPTKNSAQFIEACLESIKNQSYTGIELVVVDNYSADNTAGIAKRFTDKVFLKGPERSAQRNYGVSQSKGKYVMIIDSDMELSRDVVKACVQKITKHPESKGVIIPEESFGEGFWAQCKKLERSFYVGVDWMEAARFFEKKTYLSVGGYDENMVSGEDWDLSQRVEKIGKLDRIKELIYHNEGRLKLIRTLRKKFYYAQQFAAYTSKNRSDKINNQTGVVTRYRLFLKNPAKLLQKPLVGIGMLFMKTLEFAVGALGLQMAHPKTVNKAEAA